MKKLIRRIIWIAVLLLLANVIVQGLRSNSTLEMTTYTVSSQSLPDAFDGFRIAQVSDLHNTQFGDGNADLLAMLRDAAPDMIAITGDLIDGDDTDVESALKFAEEAMKIAPCYYVNGNHEQSTTAYFDLKNGLEALGVQVLEDDWTQLERNGQCIRIIGVMDPSYPNDLFEGEEDEIMTLKLEMLKSEDGFNLLLSHRPELFETYAQCGIDLALTGHAHGGQFRLPVLGGVYAPDQGLFPKCDAGLFSQDDTQMIVSRGLGNSVFPLRINNPPELVLIELKCK